MAAFSAQSFDAARRLLLAGQAPEAEAILIQGVDEPDKVPGPWWLLLGLCLHAQGKPARQALERAAALMPQDATAALVLSEIADHEGDRPAALAQLQAAHQADARVQAALGRLWSAMGGEGLALEALARALALDPALAEAWFHLGQARAPWLDAQVRCLGRAVVLGLPATEPLALSLADQGRGEEALALLDPASPFAAMLAARIAGEAGDPSRARTYLAQALALRPDDGEAWFTLGIEDRAPRPMIRAADLGMARAAPYARLARGTPATGEALARRVAIEALGGARSLIACDIALTRLEHVWLAANQGYVGRKGDKAVALAYLHNDSWQVLAETGDGLLIADPPPGPSFDHAIVLGDSANFYHWLIDESPHLDALAHLDRTTPILFASPLLPFHHAIFEAFDFDPKRLLRVDVGARVQIKTLSLIHHPQDGLDPQALRAGRSPPPSAQRIQRLRDLVLTKTGAQSPKRLLITRGEATYRCLLNEQALIAALRPRGFVPVALETLSLHEQAALFAKAEFVIGAHGAGFAHMIFAPESATLIELCAAPPPPFFADLTRVRGQGHALILGQAARRQSPKARDWWAFRIDLDQVHARLDALGL